MESGVVTPKWTNHREIRFDTPNQIAVFAYFKRNSTLQSPKHLLF